MLRLNMCRHCMAGHNYDFFKHIWPTGIARDIVMPEILLDEFFEDYIHEDDMWAAYVNGVETKDDFIKWINTHNIKGGGKMSECERAINFIKRTDDVKLLQEILITIIKEDPFRIAENYIIEEYNL